MYFFKYFFFNTSENKSERLKNFDVYVGNDSTNLQKCHTHTGPVQSGGIVELNCTHRITGRIVHINKTNNNHVPLDNLALCEVGVYET